MEVGMAWRIGDQSAPGHRQRFGTSSPKEPPERAKDDSEGYQGTIPP